tara:strand:- start:2788 stop:3960 length:1173 start_codon:yes stop_codon:yes gene_type:complete
MALPANASAINTADTISDTIKTTAGYFTNGDGTIGGTDIHTGSLADSNEKYYFNVTQIHPDSSSAETQFSVTFGHYFGSGSDTIGDSSTNPNTLNGETQAVYQQLASLLMEETEVSGGFKIAAAGSSLPVGISAGEKDEYVYALIGKRSKFKDRMNKKSWTLTLSGSSSAGSGSTILTLTDDSATQAPTATPGGPRHSIVSGALGSVVVEASNTTYGWFYPEMGIMLFSGAQLSASIPGQTGTQLTAAAQFHRGATDESNAHYAAHNSSSGFAPNIANTANAKNALRFVNCMKSMNSNTSLRLRSEEDQTQENYFCRIKADEYNFSANPTFVSGSKNKLRNLDMHGNPQTFITGVGLYNSAGQLLAIAKLSSPLKKNFASEATIKVKLTY